IGNDNTVSGGLLGAATLLAVNYLVVRFLFKHEQIDRLVEGEPTPLMENGKINEERLAHELLTHAELEIPAHKQGFASLEAVDKCIVGRGGVISSTGKKPTPEGTRPEELTAALKVITRELADVKALLAARG